MKPLVLIPQPIAAPGAEFLRERGYDLHIGCDLSPAGLRDAARDCDAILVRTARIGAEVIENAAKLKVVAKHGVGYDNIAVEAATRRGVWVVNAPNSNAVAVAEWTIGALVALARNFRASQRAVETGDWAFRDRVLGMGLAGKTLGILGLGRIGTQVARRAALGLEMRVVAWTPSGRAPDGAALGGAEVEMAVSRDELILNCDFLTLHLPGGEANRGAIGARELAMMPRGGYLINATRGEVVDETALAAALQSGHLAGAALDVFENEPPPRDHPLLHLPNVLATPHNSALTHEATVAMALDAARGIDEVLSGQRPSWPVNVPAEEGRRRGGEEGRRGGGGERRSG